METGASSGKGSVSAGWPQEASSPWAAVSLYTFKCCPWAPWVC